MSKITDLLGDKVSYYLDHTCKTIDKSMIHVPSPETIDRIWIDTDRNIQTLRSLQTILGHGRLANTGYVSILPVDQDIEHTAGASFAPNPIYFDPENKVQISNALRSLVEDYEIRQQLVIQGYNNVKRFSWNDSAKLVDDLVKIVCNEIK